MLGSPWATIGALIPPACFYPSQNYSLAMRELDFYDLRNEKKEKALRRITFCWYEIERWELLWIWVPVPLKVVTRTRRVKIPTFCSNHVVKDWYENFLRFLLWSKQSELLTGGINKNLLEIKKKLTWPKIPWAERNIPASPHLDTSIFSRNVGDGRFWEEKKPEMSSQRSGSSFSPKIYNLDLVTRAFRGLSKHRKKAHFMTNSRHKALTTLNVRLQMNSNRSCPRVLELWIRIKKGRERRN